MRNPTLPGADGPANLLASIQVAASEAARGLGAVVVLNDEIHAARFVRKTHTSNPATFRSDPVGPVGWISEDTVRVVLRPAGRRKITLSEDAQDRPVALHTVTLGDDGRLLPEIERHGYAGLVIEGLGGGHVPSVMVELSKTSQGGCRSSWPREPGAVRYCDRPTGSPAPRWTSSSAASSTPVHWTA